MGTVFTFDNPKYESQYCLLRAFDCSFISRFKEEDEYLFFGGFYRIKVVNVRLIKTKQNMQKFVAALFYFDAMLTGASLYKIKTGKNDYSIIDNLIKTSLSKQTNVKLPQFMLDCFKAFTQNKKQISLHMLSLHEYADERINNLIFYSLVKRETKKVFKPKHDNLSNVIHPNLFALFPNVSSLTIDTHLDFEFCFSLLALLNVIFGTNLNQIIIKAYGYCWIQSVWN